jgi:BON domain
MMEALFGSPPSIWTTSVSPGFGGPAAFQHPVGFGIGAIGAGGLVSQPLLATAGTATAARDPAANPSGLSSSPYAPSSVMPWTMPMNVNATLPLMTHPTAFANVEAGFGVLPAVVLAAVAMRRGQPQGPSNDQEVEDFLYDALELLPGTSDVEVRYDNGRATLAGNVYHKRIKRDVGEIAWAMPGVNDVQNNVVITSRRRTRAGPGREAEAPLPANRK